MKEEIGWYVFNPEDRRFKSVDSKETAQKSGLIFLVRHIYKGEGSMRGFLEMYYTWGKKLNPILTMAWIIGNQSKNSMMLNNTWLT